MLVCDQPSSAPRSTPMPTARASIRTGTSRRPVRACSVTGDGLAMVYLDGKAMAKLIEDAAPSAGIDATMTASVPDWMVIGLRVVDDAVQIEVDFGRVAAPKLPSGAPTAPPATSHFAPLLPGDTFGFVEVHGAGANLQRTLAPLKADPSQAAMVESIEQALAAAGGVENLDRLDRGCRRRRRAGRRRRRRRRSSFAGSDAAAVTSRITQLKSLLILASTGTDITVNDTDHGGVTVTTVDLGDLQSLLSGISACRYRGTRPRHSACRSPWPHRDDVLIIAVGDGVDRASPRHDSGSSLASTAAYRRTIEPRRQPQQRRGLRGDRWPGGLDRDPDPGRHGHHRRGRPTSSPTSSTSPPLARRASPATRAARAGS